MTSALIAVVLVVALLVAWLALQNLQERGKSEALRQQLQDLRQSVQAISAAQAQSTGQMSAIASGVAQRLDGVTKALQDGVAKSAEIASQSQAALAGELKNSQTMMAGVQKQIGEFQEFGRGLSNATATLQSILGGAKTRGMLGEFTLERLLEDSLPPGRFAMQYRFRTGEIADAVIFLRDEKMMAIDSKFPLEAFRRIEAGGDAARREFVAAVKSHADDIAEKYIVPAENTLDLALMFVPSESVYYEFLMSTDTKGAPADGYCREKKVFAVSPNTLYAQLLVISMGLRGFQIEENAKRLSAALFGVQKQLESFEEVFDKLGTHLRNAQQAHLDADKRLDKASSTLNGLVESGGASTAALESQPGFELSPPAPAK